MIWVVLSFVIGYGVMVVLLRSDMTGKNHTYHYTPAKRVEFVGGPLDGVIMDSYQIKSIYRYATEQNREAIYRLQGDRYVFDHYETGSKKWPVNT